MYGRRPHHFPLLFGLSLAFLGCPSAAWSKRSRSRPIILGVMNDRVIDVNDQLELTCIGNDTLSWDVPKAAQGQVTKSQCKDNKLPICLKLHLPSSFTNQTGHYSCHYAKHGGSRQSAATSVYVFIRDYKNPFMINESKHDMIFFERGQPLIIPCRVSIPDIDVTIELAGGEVKKTRIVWNNQEGFTLLIQSQDYPGLCYCETVINGTVYRSKQYIPAITDKASQNALQLNISDQIYSLVGHSFNLRCSVKDLNRLQRVLSWIYPGSKLHGKEVTEDIGTIHQSTLKVANTTLDYTGQYVCILTYMFVEDGEMKYIKHQVKTSVNVLEKPLILLRSNTTRTIEVLKDQLSVKIKVEMEAYPTPETEWLKDNGVILSKQIRYLQQSQGKTFTLTIHELKREDAGLYVFWARACGNGITVTQNISFYLQVYEPPQVEGGLTVKDITYPLRSKQTLLCSAFGVPMPDIFWQWKPGSCENETGNHFPQSDGWWAQRNSGNVNGAVPNVWLSFEGSENKTLSTMEIYDAQFSGCYRCVSHNYLGNDSFGFAFYVTDVPSGLNIHLRDSGPMRVVEGDPLNLECAANKHLFSTPRWFLREEVLHTNFTETSREGDYSLISQLDFAMAQQVHGGVYECEARSCLTGILHRTNFTLILQSEQFVSLQRNLSDMTVNSGDSLVLRCDVTGSPVPNVTWYKDGQLLNSGKAINIDQGVLRIDRVKEEEAGEYLCSAENRLGAVESKAVVTVKGTHDQSNLTIVLLCTGVIGILLWLLLVLFIRRIRQPSGADNKRRYLSIIVDPEEVSLNEQCEQLPYDSSKWEFPHDRLKLGKTLGRGAFGRVMEASAFGIDKSSTCKTVAVKMLKEGATSSEYRALMSELKILIHIGHHLNVVNLLGACTKPGGPLMVIVEYCKHGNLSNYLRSKREDFYTCKEKAEVTKVRPINEHIHTQEDDIEEDEEQTKRRKRKKKDYKKRLSSVDSSESSTSSGFAEEHWLSEAEDEEDEDPDKKLLTMEDLICYSFQVAKGMAFLASRKCIHRDLAARNILLAKNNVVKICDFGLARDIYKDPDYVRKGDARLPLKWMAPECIFDKVYTTQCDVWSFGVLLWEIFSLGASPYPGVHIDEEFCHRLKEGIRMKPPEYASPAIYEIMLECWFGNPQDRPTFAMLVDRLGDLLEANVQEDGKDYIPLNTSTVLDDDSGTSFPTSPASCLGEDPHDPKFNYDNTAGIRYCNIGKTALRPVSVKTFDEVPFEPSTPASCEENQTDSGMILASEELKKLEARPKSLIAIGRSLKGCSKSKESLWSESAATHQSSYSPDMAGHTCPFLEEDGASVLGQTNLDYYAGSPPPDYSIAMRYTASPV